MCPMAASAAASHRSLRTVRPETAWKVVGVTNCPCCRGHHHLHRCAALAQAPHQVGALVGGDTAGHAQENAFALHGNLSCLRGDYRTAPAGARKRAHE